MNKNILNKVSTVGVVAAITALVALNNPIDNVNFSQAFGYGSTPNANSLKLDDDCRVNGNCSTKKEETKTNTEKKEENKTNTGTKTEDTSKKEETTKEENSSEKPVEKEINGKKYYVLNDSNIILPKKVLKDISSYKTKFNDINNSSSKEDIVRLEMAEIVKGTTPTTFEPNRAITRAEYLAIVMGAYGYDITKKASELPFSDVKVDWQKRVISAALENGIVAGDVDASGNKIFRPNSQISKIEAYAILSNISEIYFAEDLKLKHSFIDAAADWQNEVLAEAEYLELVKVNADKKFNPNMGISRADMSTLIVKYARLY